MYIFPKRGDVRKLPGTWRATLGIIVAITAMFLKYVTEELHFSHDSWRIILIGVVYYSFIVAVVAAIPFLRRKLSSRDTYGRACLKRLFEKIAAG